METVKEVKHTKVRVRPLCPEKSKLWKVELYYPPVWPSQKGQWLQITLRRTEELAKQAAKQFCSPDVPLVN